MESAGPPDSGRSLFDRAGNGAAAAVRGLRLRRRFDLEGVPDRGVRSLFGEHSERRRRRRLGEAGPRRRRCGFGSRPDPIEDPGIAACDEGTCRGENEYRVCARQEFHRNRRFCIMTAET